jgi:hypothetical protein
MEAEVIHGPSALFFDSDGSRVGVHEVFYMSTGTSGGEHRVLQAASDFAAGLTGAVGCVGCRL